MPLAVSRLAAPQAATMSNISLADCSILICEDEPLIALGIANAFSETGARVVAVKSLARAFAAIEKDAPSAVILDHALSDGESSRLCAYLKERNIPYILHSGYPNHDDGAVSVPKPAAPQMLVSAVEGLLGKLRTRLRSAVNSMPVASGAW
jgi:DNA-binding response OmpR family regulator